MTEISSDDDKKHNAVVLLERGEVERIAAAVVRLLDEREAACRWLEYGIAVKDAKLARMRWQTRTYPHKLAELQPIPDGASR